jgi:hypothetical protein
MVGKAFNDIERKRYEKTVGAFVEKRRPPLHIRPELDLGFRVAGQSVEIFEIRPACSGLPRRLSSLWPRRRM